MTAINVCDCFNIWRRKCELEVLLVFVRTFRHVYKTTKFKKNIEKMREDKSD